MFSFSARLWAASKAWPWPLLSSSPPRPSFFLIREETGEPPRLDVYAVSAAKRARRENGKKRVRFADDVIDQWRMNEDGEDINGISIKRSGRRKRMKRLDYSSPSP
ncbi:hypothetical protein SAY87_005927 [Trapa incisa]|uniref:Uncharacterized protein n=1 Tax=Trapa incisa TaxID=236973 RepID=A0AAN7K6X2_9MYRT|nr:hypothetical protein SAY87_005927 [Trapa incisa]